MHTVQFHNARGLRLVGSFFPAASSAIVVLAHGFTSDRVSRGRFPRLAQALSALGISALSFDFAGCGESDDDGLSLAKQTEDLRAAVAFVQAQGFQQVGLFGLSLGGLVCLSAEVPQVKAMVLTGAPTGPMYYDWSNYYSADQMRALNASGRLTTAASSGVRQSVVIERELLDAFARVDPPTLLGRVRCPTLLIHGDGDEEERSLLERSRLALPLLPPTAKLEVIVGARHGFLEEFDQVTANAGAFFAAHLKPPPRRSEPSEYPW